MAAVPANSNHLQKKETMCKDCANLAAEKERILKELAQFQNPAWRKHYLEAIRKIVNG
jgi:hypothetical protein